MTNQSARWPSRYAASDECSICHLCASNHIDMDHEFTMDTRRKEAVTFQAPKRVTAGEDEWVVIARDEDGNRIEAACYYTDDLDDAKSTRAAMQQRADEIAEGRIRKLEESCIGKTCTLTNHTGCGAPKGYRPFTKNDWDAFSGCESDRPFIATDVETSDVDWTFVVDGLHVEAHDDEGRSFGATFQTKPQADLIAELLLSGAAHPARILVAS